MNSGCNSNNFKKHGNKLLSKLQRLRRNFVTQIFQPAVPTQYTVEGHIGLGSVSHWLSARKNLRGGQKTIDHCFSKQ